MTAAFLTCRAYRDGEFADAALHADRLVLGSETFEVASMTGATRMEGGLLATVTITVDGRDVAFDVWNDEAGKLCEALSSLIGVAAA
ncbi:hypothetical protein [Longispora albida]|uniref:hypothetical protein n=1 Tax=Longispora albida TaxID=203523 RepID=UPI0012FB5E8C|nr:hypothetical protein [Longispora albida]